jgi:WD40 repeat protein
LAGHTAAVTSVAFAPDGTRAITASADFTAKLWDCGTGKEILNLKGHTQELTSVTFSQDGRYILTGSQDGTAILWLTADWGQPRVAQRK